MGHLLDAIDSKCLTQSWNVTYQNALDGEPTDAIKRFAEESENRIERLASDLAKGSFRPSLLTEVRIPKDDGSFRLLHVPSVRDRVLERAILELITPRVEPWLGSASYAYRKGLGVTAAVREVVALRDEGLNWVLRTDIDDCFPSIPLGRVKRLLKPLLEDDELFELVSILLNRRVSGSKRVSVPNRGLSQGSPLSPLLSNLVLASFDSRLLSNGFPLVRFADDIVVFGGSRATCQEALAMAEEELRNLDMRLGPDKTEIMSFEDGFCFLGEDFGPRYPPSLENSNVPSKRPLFIARQGAGMRVTNGRIKVVSKDDQDLLDVPSGHVNRVVVFGSVGVSAGLRTWAMSNDVPIVLATRNGHLLGSIEGAGNGTRLDRLKAQWTAAEDCERATGLARKVVEAKLLKQAVLLKRFGRREHADAVRTAASSIERMISMLPDATDSAEIMGLEGAGARAYFECLGQLLPEGMTFEARSRRPPLDITNACLSYGYTILLGECLTALTSVGLDPAIGFLHSEQPRRPSLALDLMEEFRPLIVDQVVLRLVRKGSINVDSGRPSDDGPGVFLTRASRKVLLDSYEARMLQPTSGALSGFSGSWRRHVYRQAERLAMHLADPSYEWTGLAWR